jgi:hypothetical protein
MLRRKIPLALIGCAFASVAFASTQHVELTDMVTTVESTSDNKMSVDLTENSFVFSASEEMSSIFITEFVVAAHYIATWELPDKVTFMAGEQVVNINSNANVMLRNAAYKSKIFEEDWRQTHAYNF